MVFSVEHILVVIHIMYIYILLIVCSCAYPCTDECGSAVKVGLIVQLCLNHDIMIYTNTSGLRPVRRPLFEDSNDGIKSCPGSS